MHRSETLPQAFRDWIKAQPEAELRQRLGETVISRMKALRIDMTDQSELDQKYFALQESEDQEKSMRFFRQARLAAAAGFLKEDSFNDALYEYYHSCNSEKEAIEGLTSA